MGLRPRFPGSRIGALTPISHYLRPLLAPHSVALVGATEREGALGNIVYRNLSAGGLGERLYAVNPKHARVYGRPAYPRLADLPERAELAVIVTPARTVPGIIDDAAAAGIKAAIVLSSGFAASGDAALALVPKLLGRDK